MWKSCFDCVSGAVGESEVHREGPVNGMLLKKSFWPPPSNMFNLPRRLENEDKIVIDGNITNQNIVVVAFCMDQHDIFHMVADFNENNITLIIFSNGYETSRDHVDAQNYNMSITNVFPESSFNFTFQLFSTHNGDLVEFFSGNDSMHNIKLDHAISNITHIRFEGVNKINELSFKFA